MNSGIARGILLTLCGIGTLCNVAASAPPPAGKVTAKVASNAATAKSVPTTETTKDTSLLPVGGDGPLTSEMITVPGGFRGVNTVRTLLGQVAGDLKFVQQDGKILVVGTPADIQLARKVVEAAQTGDIQDPETEKMAAVVSLGYIRPEDAMRTLSQVLPGMEVNWATPNTAMTVSSPGPFASTDKSLTTLLTADAGSGQVVGVVAAEEAMPRETITKAVRLPAGTDGAAVTKMAESTAVPTAMTGNSLVLVGTMHQLDVARALLKQIDSPPAQVIVEARMLELSPEYAQRLGISWADIGGVLTSASIQETGAQSGVRFGRFTRSPIEIQATISGLIRDGQARMLANPSVSVVNEQEAVIFVGDQLKYLAAQSVDENGRPIFTLANQDVGVNLVVKPSINLRDNTVTLKLVPSVSTFVQFVEAPGGGALPQVRTRLVNTTVRLKDGELMAIGGLISDQDVTSMQKVPFLADLPILGQFFRHRRKEHTRTELAILIRPRIVRDNEALPAAPFSENLTVDSVHPLAETLGGAAALPSRPKT
jgi:type II secretory pathway component GspD/PulD (secretin)